jgi:hypothetical protein
VKRRNQPRITRGEVMIDCMDDPGNYQEGFAMDDDEDRPRGSELERKIERDHVEARERLLERRKEKPLYLLVPANKPLYRTLPGIGRCRIEIQPMAGGATVVRLFRMASKKERRSG